MNLLPGTQGGPAVEAMPMPSAPPPGKPTTPRFVLVDALRGVAATWVVLCHAIIGGHLPDLAARLPRPVVALMEAGRVPVSIFFVLSGFVIAYSVSRHEVNARFVGRFALRRSIRLDPPYWAAIALTLAIGYASQFFVAGKVYPLPEPWSVAAHLLYLQEILGAPEINIAFWTLCLEVQFYLVFCLLLALAHRFRRDEADRRSTLAIFVPVMMVSAAWPLRIAPFASLEPWFLPSWYGFLVGMAACWAMLRIIPAWLFVAYVLLLCVGVARYPDINVITCILTASLLYLAARLGTLSTWLGFRWLLFLGSISYSLYLMHNPITGAFYRVAYRLTGRGAAAELAWFAPMIAVNVAVAYGFWWLFERTSMALCHRVRMARPTRPEPPEIEPPSSRS